jgi:hypothetical protein
MRASGAYDLGREPAPAGTVPDPSAVLGAVREDIRQTLRIAWIDPALEAAASSPPFFTAAWSAIRPNVGKSFLLLTKALRTESVESVRARLHAPDLREDLRDELSDEEIRRLEESARAAHLVAAKVQIVVHALYRAARRERVAGTGREESPVRRGVPEWQRWMSFQPAPGPARSILDEAAATMNSPQAPTPLRLVARWPRALSSLWDVMKPQLGSEGWSAGALRLRRVVLAGVTTLPHPVELQWTALRARGLTDQDRSRLVEVLAGHDACMAAHTLAAALAWTSFGSPEIGMDA